ncbi:MAG TPA: NADPH-dependent F420 reductase [Anaerolineaceae bacterium]|nr:NADPH-dependent F420 reductase [Anaerolineaceae bacterium]
MTDQIPETIKTIAILGGTGKEGKGLGYRWAKAGYRVVIGSRQLEKAQAAAAEIMEKAGGNVQVEGMENPAAARAGEVVVITVPYSAHQSTLQALAADLRDKIVVDVTVPIVPPKVTRVQMPPAGSAAQETLQILGEGATVVSAFQNISYEHLLNDEPVECDVLVSGTGKAARTLILKLIAEIGLTGWDAGPIENSVIAEGLTSILIGLNKQYGVQSAGIKITGISR